MNFWEARKEGFLGGSAGVVGDISWLQTRNVIVVVVVVVVVGVAIPGAVLHVRWSLAEKRPRWKAL